MTDVTEMEDYRFCDPTGTYVNMANSLLENYGEKAFLYSDDMLSRVQAMGHKNATDLWTGISIELMRRSQTAYKDDLTIIH